MSLKQSSAAALALSAALSLAPVPAEGQADRLPPQVNCNKDCMEERAQTRQIIAEIGPKIQARTPLSPEEKKKLNGIVKVWDENGLAEYTQIRGRVATADDFFSEASAGKFDGQAVLIYQHNDPQMRKGAARAMKGLATNWNLRNPGNIIDLVLVLPVGAGVHPKTVNPIKDPLGQSMPCIGLNGCVSIYNSGLTMQVKDAKENLIMLIIQGQSGHVVDPQHFDRVDGLLRNSFKLAPKVFVSSLDKDYSGDVLSSMAPAA